MATRNYVDDDRNLIRLLEYVDDADDDQDAMYASVMLRNVEPKSLNSQTLSIFLHYAAGRRTPIEHSFLKKMEIHVICRPVRRLFDHGFVARYTSLNHSLKLRAEIDLPEDFFVCEGSFIVGLSTLIHSARQPHSVNSPKPRVAAPERTNLELGQAGAAPTPSWDTRLFQSSLEVGQAVASVAFAAGAVGWEARLLGPSLGFRALGRLMGLTSETDLENELPVAAVLVFPTPAYCHGTLSISGFKSRIMTLFNDDRLQPEGRRSDGVITPEERQDDFFRYAMTAEKTDGYEHLRLDRMHCNFTVQGSFQYGPRATMRRALDARGGVAVADFDEDYTMPYGHLEQFLLRCFHGDNKEDTCHRRVCFPSGVLPWFPRVNVYVFVNRVKGFSTGLYCFVRNRLHFQRRGSPRCDTPYDWKSESIPSLGAFYLFRRPAAAPDQPQLRKSAFVVAMVAPFKDVMEENYVYMYSRQILEAGFLGEVLVVEAQAQGLSASAVNSQDYNWQAALGVNTADGNVISVYAVGKQKGL